MAIAEIELAVHGLPYLGNGFVAVQVNLLALDRFPEPLDKEIIPPTPFAIHAGLNAVLLMQSKKCGTGELPALVGVHDGFFLGIHTGICSQAVRQAPTQHPASRPTKPRAKIDETPANWDVGRASPLMQQAPHHP